jgi:integrase
VGVKVRERVKGSGVWWVFVNHKRTRKAVRVGSKSAAKAVAVDIEKGLGTGKVNLNNGNVAMFTFEDYAEKWMEQHIVANCKPGTADTTRKALDNHLLPAFGTFQLTDINREALRSYCATKKADGYASSTIRVHMSCISGPMEMAVEDGIIPANPCAGARKHAKGGKTKRPIDAMTREETRAFLSAAREHTPRFYPLFLTGLRTGMRIGELVALEWDDIDWRGRFIVVQRNFWQGHLGTTKSGKTRRVDMSDQLVAELTDHRRRMAAESLKVGRPLPDFIFSTVEGKRVWPHVARRILDALTKKTGIRKLNPHIFRHTFATQLLAANKSITYVQQQLGHSSISMTVDVYGHLVPGANREAVNVLDDHQTDGKNATPAQPDDENINEINGRT